MKVITIIICSIFYSTLFSQGLENLIIEKYYISNSNDTLLNKYNGQLKMGATTYRIYVDLLPGYRLQAVYGSKKHPMYIKTSTFFYNNGELGNTSPFVLPRKAIWKNTIMIDSWLTIGTAAEEFIGIPKKYDDTVKTIIHEKGLLQNDINKMGFPLFQRDGLKAVEIVPKVTFFGMDSLDYVLGNKCQGSRLYIDNGAWATLGKGVVGADSLGNNHVLIAQLTTDGELSMELNLQIGSPEGKIINYVARKPEGNELHHKSLSFIINKKRKLKLIK
jgi:hypothetical protein